MGVYHLMGLGLSPGTVIGPLSYLAHRYQRNGPADREFFARSGERDQRREGKKVGDVQAIVLFTTPEVVHGDLRGLAWEYVDNGLARREGATGVRAPMPEVLRRFLPAEWRRITGRKEGDLFWCEIDRGDIRTTYDRMVRVVAALAGVGGQGKEMWANLTGGTNVVNSALHLAAALSGEIARTYYVQAQEGMEKHLRCTAEDGYWVELPSMPLALAPLSREILALVREHTSMTAGKIRERLVGEHWSLLGALDKDAFIRSYLGPLWKCGLLAEVDGLPGAYQVGPQWTLIEPYADVLASARADGVTIEALAEREPWLTREIVPLA